MNKYYIKMLDTLGYSMYNGYEKTYCIYHKGTLDKLNRSFLDNDSTLFADYDSNTRIYIEEISNCLRQVNIFVNDQFWITNTEIGYSGENQIFGTRIMLDKGGSVAISVDQINPNDCKTTPLAYTIGVRICNRSMDLISSMSINQELDHATVIMDYGKYQITRGIHAEGITSENLINLIWEFINNNIDELTSYKEKRISILKGLKIVHPSLKMCLNDVIKYWKKVVLPSMIKKKNEELRLLREEDYDSKQTKLKSYEVSDLEEIDSKVNRRK